FLHCVHRRAPWRPCRQQHKVLAGNLIRLIPAEGLVPVKEQTPRQSARGVASSGRTPYRTGLSSSRLRRL
ncbi:MAG: hypothetical protein ABF641_14370, partial [Acetobacter sp.]